VQINLTDAEVEAVLAALTGDVHAMFAARVAEGRATPAEPATRMVFARDLAAGVVVLESCYATNSPLDCSHDIDHPTAVTHELAILAVTHDGDTVDAIVVNERGGQTSFSRKPGLAVRIRVS
jgi:hypothetical protein